MAIERNELSTAELTPELAAAFGRITDREEPPTTIAESLAAVETLLEDSEVRISVDQLYQSEPTRHAVHVGESVEHVPCVLDALIVAELRDESPVEIRSESPVGDETVRLYATENGVRAEPSEAVISFGVATDDIDDFGLEELSSAENVSMTTCSYINAFPNAVAFEEWEDDISEGIVMGLSVDTAVAYAERAADGWVFDQ